MFSERLKELRELFGISQSQLANAIFVTPQTISNYETGKREPKIAELIRLSEYFHVSIDYLVGNTDDINAPHREIFYTIMDSIFVKSDAPKEQIDAKINKLAEGKEYKWSENKEDLIN